MDVGRLILQGRDDQSRVSLEVTAAASASFVQLIQLLRMRDDFLPQLQFRCLKDSYDN